MLRCGEQSKQAVPIKASRGIMGRRQMCSARRVPCHRCVVFCVGVVGWLGWTGQQVPGTPPRRAGCTAATSARLRLLVLLTAAALAAPAVVSFGKKSRDTRHSSSAAASSRASSSPCLCTRARTQGQRGRGGSFDQAGETDRRQAGQAGQAAGARTVAQPGTWKQRSPPVPSAGGPGAAAAAGRAAAVRSRRRSAALSPCIRKTVRTCRRP